MNGQRGRWGGRVMGKQPIYVYYCDLQSVPHRLLDPMKSLEKNKGEKKRWKNKMGEDHARVGDRAGEEHAGTDDPGCVLWAGGTSINQKPGVRAVEGKHAELLSAQQGGQADHGCENEDSHLCACLSANKQWHIEARGAGLGWGCSCVSEGAGCRRKKQRHIWTARSWLQLPHPDNTGVGTGGVRLLSKPAPKAGFLHCHTFKYSHFY